MQGDLCATGFFVTVHASSLPGRAHVYFVTARHVAEGLEGREGIYFLVNKKGGGTISVPSSDKHFYFHPTDPAADVAVIRCGFAKGMDFVATNINDLLTPESIREKNIGIGDEVFITGLFKPASGLDRVMPILRYGNIAMIPEEPVQTELGYAEVYLIEARSIGGVSGSPVFVRETVAVEQKKKDGTTVVFHGIGESHCIGLMQSHWDILPQEMNDASVNQNRKAGVNLGIAVVTPAIKIIETLKRPELMKSREAEEEKLRKQMVPGMDSAERREPEPMPFTKADFESALKKASRKKG